MSAADQEALLTQQLTAMLPGAVLAQLKCRDWHSAGIAGRLLTLRLETGECNKRQVSAFARRLPDAEFDLAGEGFVADATISRRDSGDRTPYFEISMLVLPE